MSLSDPPPKNSVNKRCEKLSRYSGDRGGEVRAAVHKGNRRVQGPRSSFNHRSDEGPPGPRPQQRDHDFRIVSTRVSQRPKKRASLVPSRRMDLENRRWQFGIEVPYLKLESKYNIKGNILLLPVVGTGESTIHLSK